MRFKKNTFWTKLSFSFNTSCAILRQKMLSGFFLSGLVLSGRKVFLLLGRVQTCLASQQPHPHNKFTLGQSEKLLLALLGRRVCRQPIGVPVQGAGAELRHTEWQRLSPSLPGRIYTEVPWEKPAKRSRCRTKARKKRWVGSCRDTLQTF